MAHTHTAAAKTYTHKVSGWTRTPLRDMSMNQRIIPTDGSGERIVCFMSAHSWANLPNDNKANSDKDRVVLISGEPLPEWALAWLTQVNAKSCRSGRAAFQAAIDDADFAQMRREADDY